MSTSAFDLLAKPIQHVLWDMQWDALRQIQTQTIEVLLTTDHDVLVSAETASGKTEAAFLPILSQLYEQPPKSIGAIYVGPLKALINDQFRRLEDLCLRAEISVHKWHGDVDAGKKDEALRKPSGVLLITPESLESFFVNRPSTLRRMFCDLRFVVVDEIHSLVGRERGLQLRSQLFRLQRYAAATFRLVGLSATVKGSEDHYKRWMQPIAPERVQLVDDSDGPPKTKLFNIHTYQTLTKSVSSKNDQESEETMDRVVPPPMVEDIVRTFGGKKNLIFCNQRQTVEWLTDSLNEACRRSGRPPEFLVHHGSVSKEIRLFTEEQMRGTRPATAVCSSTLELGIDIGNVIEVGQIGPTWSVNSQLQRLGRSGRGAGESQRMRVLLPLRHAAADEDLVDRLYPDLLQSVAITELMCEPWYEPPVEAELDLGTLVQQILSILAEHGGIDAPALFDRLVTNGVFRDLDESTFVEVLQSLSGRELIEQMDSGLLLLAPGGEEIVHDRDFYSAFASPQELTVRHNGRTIGTLSALFVPEPGDYFLLGGRRWQTIEVNERVGEILVQPAAGKRPPKMMGGGGEIHARIREQMKLVVSGDQKYDYLSSSGHELLAKARNAYMTASPNESPIVPLGGNSFLWFTWTGTQIQRTLMQLASRAELIASDDRIAITFSGALDEVIPKLLETSARTTDAEELVTFVPTEGWRKFDRYLSAELLRRSFAQDWLDLEGAKRKIEDLGGTRSS